MTELHREQFAQFFAEVNGFRPFQWQERLLDSVLADGVWPEVIAAPTGTGKSNVVDVHVFANALSGWGLGPRIPRRLSVVVNRRAIVDSHFDHASAIRGLLEDPEAGSAIRLVSDGLARLVMSKADPARSPLVVSAMRGGLPSDPEWIDDPSACAVICATPDMWGSRLLFHGYGTSRFARSREAGLLALDSVMVLDEAHLNRQLLKSARRVADLQGEDGVVPRLQVVATTATPDPDGARTTVGVVDSDLVVDEVLAARLERPKPVELVPTPYWPGDKRPSRQFAVQIAALAVSKVAEFENDTVGCVVNSVFTAREISKILVRELGEDKVILWVGPMRPLDLERAREQHPGAFTIAGDPDVRVVVATQTLEVGIDVDFAALVTELASGPALAQRAGRLNRLGTRESASCLVVVPEAAPATGTGPYDADEIAAAFAWIERVAGVPAGIASTSQMIDPPPSGSSRRALLSRLERGDVDQLAFTSEQQVADHELAWWIRDDLEGEPATVGVVRRGPLPVDDIEARALLDVTQPVDREVYPVRIGVARAIVDDTIRGTTGHTRRAFICRDGEISIADLSGDRRLDLRPGDQLILDASHPVVHRGVIVDDDGDAPDDTIWGEATAVLSNDSDENRARLREITRGARKIVDDLESRAQYESINDLRGVIDSAVSELVRSAVIDEIGLKGHSDVQISVPALPEDEREYFAWLVVRESEQLKSDEEIRQRWSGTGPPVLLDSHQFAVGERASELGVRLGLSEEKCGLLAAAGRFHDEGKAHTGFQKILGNDAYPESLLAKSGGVDASRPSQRSKRSTLPRGWRHEQLSVVLAAGRLGDLRREDKELVLRLIGTSHGRGRSSFPHAADLLLAGAFVETQSMAATLFDEGGWEELIDATARSVGQWGCAYLEAVLRAADCMVSKEGS